MPSLTPSFLETLQEDYRQYPCFVETGTFRGDTIVAMEPHFRTLYTIEFSEAYYRRAKEKYSDRTIHFLHGDSSIVFQTLLPTLKEKTLFFLDGHWSGGDTGHSEKDCPLVEEMTLIHELFAHEAILIIDDVRLFGLDASSGKLGEDWSNIHKEGLLNIIAPRLRKVYHLDSECAVDDRLILHIGPRESVPRTE